MWSSREFAPFRWPTGLVAAALAAGTLLSACGFELRGQFELPPELVPVHIDAERGSGVRAELRALLRRNDVEIATDRRDAASVIEIIDEKRERRVLTVSGDTADVDQIELRHTTRWLLRDTGEERRALTNLETVEIVRDFNFDREAVLAKQSEEAALLERMREDTALRILNRLQFWQPERAPEPEEVETQLEQQGEN